MIDVAFRGRLGDFALDVAFEAPMQGVTALFGPSGCGKTSVLRGIAGLSRHAGHVRIGAAQWQADGLFLPPHKRPVGYVFQEASLFGHLSVEGNLRYGQKRAGASDRLRFDEVVDLLGLGALVGRRTAYLSGGERQRVSIGRALLSRPELLLMDEPMSALDRDARDEILPYLENLHARLGLPILLVTHDLGEVERLADHLVLLQRGGVTAAGPLNQILNRTGQNLSSRRDLASVLSGRVARIEPDGLVAVDVAGTELLLVTAGVAPGDTVRVRIAAGDVSLVRSVAADTSILNTVSARITRIEPLGTVECLVALMLGAGEEAPFQARISSRSVQRLGLVPGERIFAQIKGASLAANR